MKCSYLFKSTEFELWQCYLFFPPYFLILVCNEKKNPNFQIVWNIFSSKAKKINKILVQLYNIYISDTNCTTDAYLNCSESTVTTSSFL